MINKTNGLQKQTILKSTDPEVIRAFTPMFMAATGAIIAVAVLASPSITDAKWSAGLGLAGTAIAGAAGLAQATKSESSVSVQKDGEKIEAEGNSSPQLSTPIHPSSEG